jgi:hypothetical protein
MKIKMIRMITILAVAVLMSLAGGFTTDAQATAIYDAFASSDLRITGFYNVLAPDDLIAKPVDLEIAGYGEILDEFAEFEGNAFAESYGFADVVFDPLDPNNDPFDLGIGDGTSQEANASGWAEAPPESFAYSEYLTDGAIFSFLNDSATDTFRIDFSFEYSYRVDPSVDDPLNEGAFAWIDIWITDYYFDIDFEIYEYSDTDFGGGLLEGSGTEYFSIILGPDEANELFVINDAFGGAGDVAPIPEPATMLLLGSGLAGLVGFRRKIKR